MRYCLIIIQHADKSKYYFRSARLLSYPIVIEVCKQTVSDIWFFMGKALEYARFSLEKNPRDVPVGCVIVRDRQIIAYGINTRETQDRITGHAELNALNAAAAATGSRYLTGCKLFVTLEPCPMCAGALRAAQIRELYFGAYNLREGAAGTVYNLLYPQVKVFGGIKKSDCASLLKEYFSAIRG